MSFFALSFLAQFIASCPLCDQGIRQNHPQGELNFENYQASPYQDPSAPPWLREHTDSPATEQPQTEDKKPSAPGIETSEVDKES